MNFDGTSFSPTQQEGWTGEDPFSKMHIHVVHRLGIKNPAADALSLLNTEVMDKTLLANEISEEVVPLSNPTISTPIYRLAERLKSAVYVKIATSTSEICKTL